jgi:hypothetical protein
MKASIFRDSMLAAPTQPRTAAGPSRGCGTGAAAGLSPLSAATRVLPQATMIVVVGAMSCRRAKHSLNPRPERAVETLFGAQKRLHMRNGWTVASLLPPTLGNRLGHGAELRVGCDGRTLWSMGGIYLL